MDKMVYRQNGIKQNGMDKMVYRQNGIKQNGIKQNGMDKMVQFYILCTFQFN